MMSKKSIIRNRKIKIIFAIVSFVIISFLIIARLMVSFSASRKVYTEVEKIPHCKVAVVLGTMVYPDGRLSELLRDRVDAGILLYKSGKVDKLLMSGDNRTSHYNEPMRMRDYAVKSGVPEKDIIMDFAGRRTWDSMYRAKHIFGQNRFIVVSQRFHVNRALFLCKYLGIDAFGMVAKSDINLLAELREFPACVLAVLDAYVLHPKPILGRKEKI